MYRPFRKATFKTPQILRACLVLTILTAFICVAGTLYAQNLKPEGWRRMRTNSVPYQPHNVTVDNAGGVWVTAIDTSENDPGVWYRPPEASSGPAFQYFTNDARNNLLLSSYNPAVVMPQLNASVLYAARDKAGNTWYALKNRTVIVEKPDHTWVAFDMPDSSPYDYQVSDTTNVDSAHRIRFIDKPDGSQETLLIAYRGIHHINSGLSIVETRQVYTLYNNDYIQDALIDSHGRYWITSERGLEKGTSLVNTIFTSVEFEADPNAPAKPVTRIMEDSEGNIWFAGDLYVSDGIYCYTAVGQWIKYDD